MGEASAIFSLVMLGYLIDSNAAAQSVDSDIFYAVIYLSAHSKTCSNTDFSKVVSNCAV